MPGEVVYNPLALKLCIVVMSPDRPDKGIRTRDRLCL